MKKILILLPLVFLFSSCEKLLEEETYSVYSSEGYFQNETQLRAQALGLYDNNPHSYIVDRFTRYLLTQTKYFATRVKARASDAAYDVSPGASELQRFWQNYYQIISRANTIIKYAPESPVSKEIVDQYVAEARWMRAYCYFFLVRFYGAVPLLTEPVESLSNEVLYIPKSPLSDIYDLMEEDLIFAKDNLPKLEWNDSPMNRVLAAGAYNLLGLVYLTRAGEPLNDSQGYTNAIQVLEELVNNEEEYGVALLTDWHSNFENDNKVNSEKLFALGSTALPGYGSQAPRLFVPPGSVGLAASTPYQICLTYEFYQLYEDQDIRKQTGFIWSYVKANGDTVTYDPNGPATGSNYAGLNGISTTKYIDGTAPSNITHINEELYMRYAESFLILAEAYCETGNLEKAREYVNVIRTRANASLITSNDQAELRQIIRDERWRELYFEFTELFDMRRWGTARENFENHPIIQKFFPTLPAWDDKFLLFPIPTDEISRNPALEQNPGW